MDTEGSGAFPIERCIPDIFLAILQAVIDDEAAEFAQTVISRKRRFTAARDLALVSRRWKEVVYGTPSLWPVIVIDFLKLQNDRLKQRFVPRNLDMAKKAPVDLFFYDFNPEWNYAAFKEKVDLDGTIPRFLYCTINNSQSRVDAPIFSQQWPILSNLREATYMIPMNNTLKRDLTTHFDGMRNLKTLKITNCNFTLPIVQQRPVLPVVTKLAIHTDFAKARDGGSEMLLGFLSNAPLVEELDITTIDPENASWLDLHASITPFTLSQLHTIRTAGKAILMPFFQGIVKTPALQTFLFLGQLPLEGSDLTDYLEKHSSITNLTVCVGENPEYVSTLGMLVHLQTLDLQGDGPGAYLQALYAKGNPIFPSLRQLRITKRSGALYAEYFRKVVKARCIPTDAERRTASGCIALEKFTIVTEQQQSVLKNLETTSEWKQALVERPRQSVVNLCWA